MNKLFQLYDRKAEAIAGPIMIERKEGPAIRAFHGVLADQNTNPGQYPEDYDLICIGEQNPETGEITPCTPPRVVATGTAWTAASGSQQAAPLRGSDMTQITLDALKTPGTLTGAHINHSER